MAVLKILNIADFFFIAIGLAVAFLLILMGSARRDRSPAPREEPPPARRRGRSY